MKPWLIWVVIALLQATRMAFGQGMEFVVTVPQNTMPEDNIFLQSGGAAFPMEKIAERTWRVRVTEQAIIDKIAFFDFGSRELFYAYTRGLHYFGGEFFAHDPDQGDWEAGRTVSFKTETVQHDAIQRWRFFPPDGVVLPPLDAVIVPFLPRLGGEVFQAGFQIADYWPGDMDGPAVVDPTSRAIKRTHANFVQIAPPGTYEQVFPIPIIHETFAAAGLPGYSEKSLRFHIRNLKAHGFKVLMQTQLCCNSPSLADLHNTTTEWWDTWFAQYENLLLFYAGLAEEEGVDAIILGDGDLALPPNPNVPEDTVQRWTAVMTKAREVYPGPFGWLLFYAGQPGNYGPPFDPNNDASAIAHLFDFMAARVFTSISDNASPTQTMLDANTDVLFKATIDLVHQQTGLPIVLGHVSFAAYDGTSMNTLSIDERPLMAEFFQEQDAMMPYDGIEQAMSFHAFMKNIASRPHIVGFYPFNYSWLAHPLGLAPSVRGKAAEKLLGEWYDAITLDTLPPSCPHDGDVNYTGNLTPDDALLAFKHFLHISKPPLDACQQERANVDDSETSKITPADALCIFRKFLSLPSCLD